MNALFKLPVTLFIITAVTCQAQTATTVPPPTPYTIVSRSGFERVLQRTVYESSPSGQAIPHQEHYTEVASGLCYNRNGQWLDSSESISLLPDGAAATNGQTQVSWPADIYNGPITEVGPDGVVLKDQPIGLFFDDGSNTVLIAALQSSVGQLINSNQIIYTNCLAGVSADILYTYRKSGLEQDIVFRAQLPVSPEHYSMDPADTRLQLATEFFNPPAPAKTMGAVNPEDGLQDTMLAFGSTRMIPGKAFLTGASATGSDPQDMPVYKSWVTTPDGRNLLIEQLPWERVSPQLATLPAPPSGAVSSVNPVLRKVSPTRVFPPAHLVETSTNTIRVASAELVPGKGLTMDYITVSSSATDFVFQGNETYLIDGNTWLYGTTLFEGGSVIKANSSGSLTIDVIDLNGAVQCDTSEYRPCVFTSCNDNSIGEIISGSSGSPNFQDVGYLLTIYSTNTTLSNFRFCYGQNGIYQYGASSPISLELRDSQFMDVATAINANDVNLYNVLIGNSMNESGEIYSNGSSEIFAAGTGANVVAENVTADSGYSFVSGNASGDIVAMTNCLITGQMMTNVFRSHLPAIVTNDVVWLPSPASPIYQTVGDGNYYLTNNSPYRGVGTTNIDPGLLSDLAQKTTWPPIVYSVTNISSLGTIGPVAARDDNGTPDLGYHYDVLDYAFGGCNLHSNLTVTAGTAVGWYYHNDAGGINDGITLNDGANLSFNGTATQPCFFSRHTMVQEGGNGVWNDVNSGTMGGITPDGSGNMSLEPQLSGYFAKWTAEGASSLMRDAPGYAAEAFQNCEFYNGSMASYEMQSLDFTNCLFFRNYFGVWDQNYAVSFAFENCTFYNGGLAMNRSSGESGISSSFWLIENTTFDGAAFNGSDNYNGSTNHTHFDYNAYNTNNLSWQTYWFSPNYGTLETNGPNDVLVTNDNWERSWFGSFYLPPDSPLIDAGSILADQIGLYQFTTQTNQTKEATSIVDIGYHYVATDGSGNPLDNNSDGIPDYLEDANGNGNVDSGEIGWNVSGDRGLNLIITQPRNGSVLP